MEFQKQMNP